MNRRWLAGGLGLLLALTACDGSPKPTQESMDSILTAVAATIAAKKTQGTPMQGTPISELNTPAAAVPTRLPPVATRTPGRSPSPSPSPSATATPTGTPTPGGVTEGLLVDFAFDEPKTAPGDEVPDQSGQGNPGRVVGLPQFVTGGRFGSAYSFRAADYVALSRNPTAGLAAFSVSLWFKTDTPDQDYKLASAATWQDGQGSGWVLGTRFSEAWSADHASLLAETCYRKFTPAPKAWNHLVLTYDRVRFREYVNGRLALDCPATGQTVGPGAPLEVGAWAPLFPFNYAGQMDDFRLYGRALSAGEVLRLYAPELTATLNNRLLVYYPLRQPAGSVIKDESGAGLDGAVTGALGYQPIASGALAPGPQGGALAFQNSSLVTLPRNPTAGLSAFAAALWFKTDHPDLDTKLATAATWRNSAGSGWTLGTSFSEFWSDDGVSIVQMPCYRSLAPLPSEWNHLVVSYDGRRLQEYVNGEVAMDCETTRRPLGAGRPVEIGGWSSLRGFDYTGLLAEFRLYGRALTPIEVLLLMHTGAGR